MPLTDAAVRAAKPTGKTQRLWDTGGLYLEVSPKGGRWWRFKYRVGVKGAKREKRISLGVYPEVSLKQARAERDRQRALLASGVDPSAARQAGTDGDGHTFGRIATEWLKVRKPGWAESHATTVHARLNNDILPYIGKRTMLEVTAPVVLDVIRRVESRGANETARRIKTIIGLICKYAIATGRSASDPTAALTQDVLAPAPKVKHHAAPLDPKDVGRILRALWEYKGSPEVRAALRLGPMVFVRPGELRHAKWSDIDLDGAAWSFPASKTGQPHVVPLSTQAVEIMRDLQPVTGSNVAGWVFPGRDPAKPMSNTAVLGAMRRSDIGPDELTGHGWRATARTLLVEELQFLPEVVELQLAHSVRDPLGRAYNRVQWLAERQRMMQAWSDWLDQQRCTVSPTDHDGR
ncbi:MAG: tyrosine-type recombinase/integrase [Planctomycetota bacterium]